MMTILLGVFAIATGVSALYLERKLLRIQKPIETISVDSQKLRAKIGATPPLWMLSQIQKDLSKYEAGIKEKMLNEAFQGKRINQLALVRFTIKDRHLSFSLDERNLNSFRFKQVLASMQLLNQEVELPNVDFIVSLEDALDENCGMPLCPCFVFAKKETQDSLVLIPDFKALAGYHSLRDVIEKGNRKFSWKSKKAKGFWRGTSTGGHLTKTNWESFMRARLVLLSLKYPKEIDARFHHVSQCDPDVPSIMKKKGMVGETVKKIDHLKYKYLSILMSKYFNFKILINKLIQQVSMKASGVLKVVVGLLLIVAAVYSFFPPLSWWDEFLTLLKGGLPVLAVMVGLVFLLLGFED